MRFLIAGAGLLALTGGVAMAQDADVPSPPPPGAARPAMQPIARADVAATVAKRFAEIDANHDGTVTRPEFDAFSAQRRAGRDAGWRDHRDREFPKLDANRDGALSKQEYTAPPPPPNQGDAPPPPGGPGGHHGRGGMIGMGPRWFDEADGNHDGKVTLAEAQAAALARFDRLDANRDGRLTPDEMMKGMWAMRGRHGGPGGDMPPPPPEQ